MAGTSTASILLNRACTRFINRIFTFKAAAHKPAAASLSGDCHIDSSSGFDFFRGIK